MTALMKTSAIPLVHAVLCLDCNCVTDANQECPVCSSRALMNLASVLDRQNMLTYSLKGRLPDMNRMAATVSLDSHRYV